MAPCAERLASYPASCEATRLRTQFFKESLILSSRYLIQLDAGRSISIASLWSAF